MSDLLPEFDLDHVANTIGDEIARMVIEKLVKQDVLVPVIRAKWIKDPDSLGIYCSNCKKYSFSTYGNYCPNCGARMDEEF